jgi:uncharacterized protein with HEPN domain
MPPDPRKWLEDIRRAATLILQFTSGRSLETYASDELIRSAVERQFEIIGEALSRLLKMHASVAAQIGDYQQIIAFRNVLIHGYDAVDDAVVWDVVQKDLPLLKQQVEGLLASMGSP